MQRRSPFTPDEVSGFMAEYAGRMNAGVRDGRVDAPLLAGCFAADFIGASSGGVMAGRNEGLAEVIAGGTEAYRRMGGLAFVAEHIDTQELAPNSFMTTVSWRFDYRRPADGQLGSITFTNRYLISTAQGGPVIFAWITPDEQAALREHGLVPA